MKTAQLMVVTFVSALLLSSFASAQTAPGIYAVIAGEPRPLQPAQAKVKKGSIFKRAGFMALSSGLASGGVDVSLAGKQAAMKLSAEPVFHFHDSGSIPMAGTIPVYYNPQTYMLVRVRIEKKERVVEFKRVAFGSTSMGVDDNNMVELEAQPLDGGGFEVKPKAPLSPGEYAFVTIHGMGPVFDFSVQ